MVDKKIPLRKCTGCQEMKSKKDMIRVIKDKDNNFSLDLTGKKAGRGAYVCRRIECLEKAEKNKGFERSFKTSIPKEVYKSLKEELIKSNE